MSGSAFGRRADSISSAISGRAAFAADEAAYEAERTLSKRARLRRYLARLREAAASRSVSLRDGVVGRAAEGQAKVASGARLGTAAALTSLRQRAKRLKERVAEKAGDVSSKQRHTHLTGAIRGPRLLGEGRGLGRPWRQHPDARARAQPAERKAPRSSRVGSAPPHEQGEGRRGCTMAA